MRRGASSVRYSAVATAIGTPISSAMPAVTSVPTSIGHAPNVQLPPVAQAPPCWSWDVSQLLWNRKLKTPMWLNALEDSLISVTKNAAISTSTPPARAASPNFRTWSGSRLSGDRSSEERPPPRDVALASTY